ncbi:MAG: N-acetyltransferase [Prevotella sp.]|nr:N-acetyltransferase [Prevotella sp.]
MNKQEPLHFTIRLACCDDARQLLDIYRPYVLETAITFEYEVPSIEEFWHRIETTLARYPYLVAETSDGVIIGYAYASAFKSRAAYDWAVELSVYISAEYHHSGIGHTLYQALEDILKQQHVTNLNACITYSDREDTYHDNTSTVFHEKSGFIHVAHFHQCGYKFDRWWDMIWMEKMIAPHDTPHPPFIPFQELCARVQNKFFEPNNLKL